MPASKIVDEQEVIRWFEEGRSYPWMSREYQQKYNIEMSRSAWGSFRSRHGLPSRNVRDDKLIPWAVKEEHRWAWDIRMLRAEARRRAGAALSSHEARQVESWKRQLVESGRVLHYDPDTEQGWFYVPPREGVDTDLIREPDRKTGRRSAS